MGIEKSFVLCSSIVNFYDQFRFCQSGALIESNGLGVVKVKIFYLLFQLGFVLVFIS